MAHQHQPGPNDWNAVVTKDPDGNIVTSLEPGLGADEPSDELRRSTANAAEARLREIKKEINETLAGLSDKEKALLERERAVEAREQAVAIALSTAANADGTAAE